MDIQKVHIKMAANLTQILNFKHNFHKDFELLKNFLSILTIVGILRLSAPSKQI